MNDEINAFIEHLATVESVADAQSLVAKTLAQMGFERYSYIGLHMPNAKLVEPVLLHSYSPEWVERYFECDYGSVDPVVATGLVSNVPFMWGGDQHRKLLQEPSRNMMDEACDFGLAKGFSVPVHGAKGELAVLSVSLPDDCVEAQKHIENYRHEVHLIALHFHSQMGDRLFAEGSQPKVHLSDREGECLLWAAQGKTAWETSEILKISEHTVREYIKNACRKLGVHSKNHAVVKSMVMGLIDPKL